METIAPPPLPAAPPVLADQPPWLTDDGAGDLLRVPAAPEPIGWWMIAIMAATALSVVCSSGAKVAQAPAIVTFVQARS